MTIALAVIAAFSVSLAFGLFMGRVLSHDSPEPPGIDDKLRSLGVAVDEVQFDWPMVPNPPTRQLPR